MILRIDRTVQTAQGQAISGALVYFLTQPANAGALTPLANVYSNITGTLATNPQITDGLGQIACYLDNAQLYTMVVVSPLLKTQVYSDQNLGLSASSTTTVAGSMFGGVPSGSIDGANTTFMLPSAPTVLLFQVNSATLINGVGYSLAGNVVTLAIAPQQGDAVYASGFTAIGGGAAPTNPSQTTINATLTGLSGPQSAYVNNASQILTNATITGPGWSLGNSGGWSVSKGENVNLLSNTRGITQTIGSGINHRAVGDTAGIYSYVYSDGGTTAESDEGVTGINVEVNENQGYFHGSIASTSGVGDQKPALAFVSGNNWTTDGGILLNISKGTLAGNLNGVSQNFGNGAPYLKFLPVTGVTLPLTTAWGICDTAIANPQTTRDISTRTAILMRLQPINGVYSPFTVGAVVTISGPSYPEQVIILAASAVTSNTQTITVGLSNPHFAGAAIFQGGIQGNYLSFDANYSVFGMRSSYYVFGSLTGSDMIYGFPFGGIYAANISLPLLGLEAATTSGPNSGFHLYPGAEIVANTAQGAFPKLEPNGVSWAAGDLVEGPHNVAGSGHGAWFTMLRDTPAPAGYGYTGVEVNVLGKGISASTSGILLRNFGSYANFDSNYPVPGPLSAPTAIDILGQWANTIRVSHGPSANGALILVNNFAGNAPAASITKPMTVIQLPVQNGSLLFTPSTQMWNMQNLTVGGLLTSTAEVTTRVLTAGSVATNLIAMADIANGHTYKLEMINGVLTPTQIS